MTNEDLEKRVSELEIKISFQDSTITALDSVVRSQQEQIDLLKAALEKFKTQQHSAAEGIRSDTEKPPHY